MYEVVDGQQRVRTILEYIKGDFKYTKKYHPKPEEFLVDFEDMAFQELPSKIQEELLSYELPVEMITQATDDEIRNAMFTGDFKDLAYSLAEDPFWLENKIVSQGDIRRMRDAEYVSELLMAMLWGPQDKKKRLDECYAKYETMEEDQKETLRRSFLYIIGKIKEILPDLKTTRFKNKGDFYSLFYAFYEFRNTGYFFPSDSTPIRETLIEIHKSASLGLNSPDPSIIKYYEGCLNSPDSLRNRRYRIELIKNLLKPLFIETDDRRFFTEQQKQFIWHNSPNKICAICGKEIKRYDDYEPDHKIPWSKGGHTSITNAQLVHKICNRKKGAKT